MDWAHSNKNLPSFVVIAPKQTYAGNQVFASDFLPGSHQGTFVSRGTEPIVNVAPRIPTNLQSRELEALRSLNDAPPPNLNADPLLEARLRTFETAFGMQMAVPDAFNFQEEDDRTHEAYGLQRGLKPRASGWQCLAARTSSGTRCPFRGID